MHAGREKKHGMAKSKALDRFPDPKKVHAYQRLMLNMNCHWTLCLASEDYKPLVRSGELVPKRKPDGNTEPQSPKKNVKAPAFTPAPVPATNVWQKKVSGISGSSSPLATRQSSPAHRLRSRSLPQGSSQRSRSRSLRKK